MSDSEITPLGDDVPKISTPLKSRLTVVENIYHQPVDGFPSTALGDTSRFSRDLQSDEQPYERRKVARGDWETLDCGWIERCGTLIIRNDEGVFSINPTPEQREMVFSRVIEVAFGCTEAAILVPPTETCRFYPAEATQVRLRCREGAARYTLYLIPE